jgi:hypothetical protein
MSECRGRQRERAGALRLVKSCERRRKSKTKDKAVGKADGYECTEHGTKAERTSKNARS